MPVRGFLGSCGSGKTYTMQTLIRASLDRTNWRFIVLDVNSECPQKSAMGPVRWTRAADAPEAAAALADGRRLVVVRPAAEPEDDVPWAGLSNELAHVAIAEGGVILCLPEIMYSAPEGKRIGSGIAQLVTRYRHNKCGLWWDTQLMATVPKTILTSSTQLYIFALPTVGTEGRKLRGLGGPALVSTIDTCGERADRGEKGHHVRLGPSRRGPFHIRRL